MNFFEFSTELACIEYFSTIRYNNEVLCRHCNNSKIWGTLKRGILCIYHHLSAKHLQKYVDEFCFRYNNRNNGNIFNLLMTQAIL
jgi:hypothetical protein